MKTRVSFRLLVLASTAFALTSCASGPESDSSKVRANETVVLTQQELFTLRSLNGAKLEQVVDAFSSQPLARSPDRIDAFARAVDLAFDVRCDDTCVFEEKLL